MREKLIALCEDVILSCKSSLCDDCEHNCIDYPSCMGVHFADHLIANGVTIQQHGRWLGERGEYVCSVCGCEGPEDGGYWASPYCPCCGAKMDPEEK